MHVFGLFVFVACVWVVIYIVIVCVCVGNEFHVKALPIHTLFLPHNRSAGARCSGSEG